MDAKLAELKRAAFLGGEAEWEAYHVGLSRCGTAHHIAVLRNEQSRIEALRDGILKRIKHVQDNCQHQWAKYHQPHSAGVKCNSCLRIDVSCRGICYSPGNCDHGPLAVEEDFWETSYTGLTLHPPVTLPLDKPQE